MRNLYSLWVDRWRHYCRKKDTGIGSSSNSSSLASLGSLWCKVALLLFFLNSSLSLYLLWQWPNFTSLINEVDGSQFWQVTSSLAIACLANRRFATVFVHSLLLCLVFMLFIWEKILSTQADECGKASKPHMNFDRRSNFALLFPSFTESKSFQKTVADWLKPLSVSLAYKRSHHWSCNT